MTYVLLINHPFDLAFFLRLVPILKLDDRHYVVCVVAKGHYFREQTDLENFVRKIADEVIVIPENKIPFYGLNLPKNVSNAFFVSRVLQRIEKKKSVLLIVDKSSYIANIFLSRFRKSILFQYDVKDDVNKYYKLDVGWTLLRRFYSLLIGGIKSSVYKNIHAGRLIINIQINKPPYREFFIAMKAGRKNIVLPSVARPNGSKTVVIFGSRFNQWKLENMEESKRLIYLIYDRIYSTFNGWQFLYKPHPREDGSEFQKIRSLFKGNLENVGISLSSELFLLRNPEIGHCFSLGSTASKSAYEMGFNAKVYYKMLPFEKGVLDTFDSLFNGMPKNFYIRSMEDNFKVQCHKRIKGESVEPLRRELNALSSL